MHLLGLQGIVALVCIMQKPRRRRFDDGDLHRGGADVNANPQFFLLLFQCIVYFIK